MEQTEVRNKIETAYKKLLKKDLHLLEKDVNERSITHKLAEYLQLEFPKYHVDCEYNRNLSGQKLLVSWEKQISELEQEMEKAVTSEKRKSFIARVLNNGLTVYPDIIIHRRGTTNNIVVIEAKKTSNNEDDESKLKAYKQDINYKYAYFVQFPVNKDLHDYTEDKLEEYIKEVTQPE